MYFFPKVKVLNLYTVRGIFKLSKDIISGLYYYNTQEAVFTTTTGVSICS